MPVQLRPVKDIHVLSHGTLHLATHRSGEGHPRVSRGVFRGVFDQGGFKHVSSRGLRNQVPGNPWYRAFHVEGVIRRFGPLYLLGDGRARVKQGLVKGQAHPTKGRTGGLIVINPRRQRGNAEEVGEGPNPHPPIPKTASDLAQGLGIQGRETPGGNQGLDQGFVKFTSRQNRLESEAQA